ncbi:hypothetical protein ACHQM5_025453 [Ranunculus cassubicifolius]
MHSRHRIPPSASAAAAGGISMRPPAATLAGGGGGGGISPEPRTFTYIRSSSFGGRMPPPKPPPRKPDVLMEAGRLATEYLISQGLLPPNLLSANHTLLQPSARLLGRRPPYYNNNRNANANAAVDKPPDNNMEEDFTATAAYNPLANHLSSKPLLTAANLETLPPMETDPTGASTASDEASNDDLEEGKNGNDLLRLCDFAKVPTKTRSSLTIKGSKVDNISMTNDETALDISPHGTPKLSTEDSSERFLLTTQTQDSKSLASDSRGSSSQSMEDVHLLGSDIAEGKCEFAASQSLMDDSVTYQQESGQSLSEFGRITSMVKDRGEKRTLQDDGMREESKKPREWTSTVVTSTEEYFPLHNFSANTSHSQHSTAPNVEVIQVDEERLFNVSILPRNESDSGTEPKEEKQLFPNSFKICDLNLMESSDMTGTHDSGSVYGTPMTSEAKKGVQVDVDLSISNNCNRSDDYDTSAADASAAVIVEVDDDSAKEDEDFNISEKRTETAHSSLESFPSQVDGTGDLADGQDGYGLMISELLGAEIPNCSSGPADITNLHGEMDLHNGAELLDEDDPIYLSLGEIPISMPDI